MTIRKLIAVSKKSYLTSDKTLYQVIQIQMPKDVQEIVQVAKTYGLTCLLVPLLRLLMKCLDMTCLLIRGKLWRELRKVRKSPYVRK